MPRKWAGAPGSAPSAAWAPGGWPRRECRCTNLYRGSSFLVNAAGEQVLNAGLTVREEPHRPKGLGSAPFDAEGVATRQRNLVDDGVLTGYCLDSYSARKLGMATTGHAGGVHNLYLEAGATSPEALLREMGTGLLVTDETLMDVGHADRVADALADQDFSSEAFDREV
ncbi:MAG: metallopeptidase TldD-related protein, partial [Thiohalorhabdaceae bacterium]